MILLVETVIRSAVDVPDELENGEFRNYLEEYDEWPNVLDAGEWENHLYVKNKVTLEYEEVE